MDVNEILTRVNGDLSKLSAEEKRRYDLAVSVGRFREAVLRALDELAATAKEDGFEKRELYAALDDSGLRQPVDDAFLDAIMRRHF
jgi:hypothetical protein